MIAIGFGLRMFAKRDDIRHIGEAILGFGILFFGMKLMGDAMKPLRTYPGFINLMKGLENPLLGLLVGTMFTALIQSSSAFTGVVIVLAQQGLITLEAGIPMVFGSNIGTCITAWLASIGTSREAKRVALAHILF
jgi:phosphate:Na+ symporter